MSALLRRPSGVVAGGVAVDYLFTLSANPLVVASQSETIASASVDSRFFSAGFDVTVDAAVASSDTTNRRIFEGVPTTNYVRFNSTAETIRLRTAIGGITDITLLGGWAVNDAVRIVCVWGGTLRVYVNGVEDAASPVSIAAHTSWSTGNVTVGEAGGILGPGDIYQPIAI